MKLWKSKAIASALALSATVAAPAFAGPNGIYVSGGVSSEDESTMQVEVDHMFPLDGIMENLSLRLGAGVLILDDDRRSTNYAVTLTPAFRYTWQTNGWKPFVEAGIGAAVFKDTHHDDRSLSTAFLFEDRLAVGFILPGGNNEIGLHATHYSNADIKEPNSGMETYGLTFRHAF